MNGDVELHNERFFGKEEVADILVRGSNLTAINVAGELIPRLIDELPLFALIASQADGMSIVSDAAELRVKESDRIETIAQELAKLGVKVEKCEDGFAIIGKQKIRGGTVMTHGDHRIGLTMAIAGLIAERDVEIIGSKSIAISYPDFFADLKAILK
jgi:3-phosphoshikimate 1-carboxyvinyltransferase